MLQKSFKSGFTLIELLVVITIIGILATGATTVYTSQIQRARDTTRIRDMDALKWAAEQVYQAESEYPLATTFVTQMSTYIKRLPADAKHGQNCNGTNAICGYAYITGPDENTIDFGAYEFSTAFESEGNRTGAAEGDGGDDDVRLEQGLQINSSLTAGLSTTIASALADADVKWACAPGDWAVADNDTDIIVINGNPDTVWNECG